MVPTTSSSSWSCPVRLAVLVVAALVVGACGGDETTDTESADTETGAGATGSSETDEGSELPNACPAAGCTIFITAAEAADGGELQLTFDANFTPDFERNHIHVFWDSQEPGSVSSDFAAQGYDVQGQWHPTDSYPLYVTESDASVTAESRGDSTTICVTAADTDHAVLDATLFACRDVAELLA